ncbi:hypothetical protein NDU88_007026 [Pleurodeles waltl]|uniref:Uncharacterized protein n=1 Tax=Pleurodeles waltl TaxID=8319 RepID=A0AAV7TYT8_PLEWA|nr:hypothetical protein NDU88_007026 [Pleurodeles waltl]
MPMTPTPDTVAVFLSDSETQPSLPRIQYYTESDTYAPQYDTRDTDYDDDKQDEDDGNIFGNLHRASCLNTWSDIKLSSPNTMVAEGKTNVLTYVLNQAQSTQEPLRPFNEALTDSLVSRTRIVPVISQ